MHVRRTPDLPHKCAIDAIARITAHAADESAGGLAPPAPETGPDGEIVGGPRTPQQIAAQKRLQQSQAQVDEVVEIMKTNVEKHYQLSVN
ncbi:unnamed protein product [Leptidea sinapis]|uniref:V-SNARE coiled-coil homology domain-containing protein n=1 Tax=Leptidea sinapis TaxID=189913 RepID=A0A5E4QDF8_9NEOP|nr:unnamed protein product [Leptidea sinapis]